MDPSARRIWDALDEAIRRRIVSAVWCGWCGDSTGMVDLTGAVEAEKLVLRGRCAGCGREMTRVVEGSSYGA